MLKQLFVYQQTTFLSKYKIKVCKIYNILSVMDNKGIVYCRWMKVGMLVTPPTQGILMREKKHAFFLKKR